MKVDENENVRERERERGKGKGKGERETLVTSNFDEYFFSYRDRRPFCLPCRRRIDPFCVRGRPLRFRRKKPL